jgi:hypothetical protein
VIGNMDGCTGTNKKTRTHISYMLRKLWSKTVHRHTKDKSRDVTENPLHDIT